MRLRPRLHNRVQNSTAWISSRPTTSDFHSTAKEPSPSSFIYTTGITLSEPNSILHSTESTLSSGSPALPSQPLPYLSRVPSNGIKPTGAYGTGRTKPYYPPGNVTQGKPAFSGSGGLTCSGTYTVGPTEYLTVTLTTTVIIGTTKIAYGAPLPSAVVVEPLPFCTTVISGFSASGYNNPANIPFAQSYAYATVLVTKKTPIVEFTPESVGPIFPASTTPVPAQHIPESTLHKTTPSATPTTSSTIPSATSTTSSTIPSATPTTSSTIPSATSTTSGQAGSGGQSLTPGLDTPAVNIGNLPGLLPNVLHPPESGSAGSGSSSVQGGSIIQDGNSGSSQSAYPSEPSQSSGSQGSDGSSQSGQTPNSESSYGSTGNESPGLESGVGEGNTGSGANPSVGSSGTTSHEGEYPPAVVINPGVTTLNNVPVSIGPGGVVVGSHTVAAGAESTIVTVNGQTFTVEPSRIVAGGTTLPFSIAPNQPYISVTVGNVPVALGPKAAVIASTTYPLGSSPTAIIHDAQTYILGSSKLVAAQTTVNLPEGNPPLAFVTAGGEIFSVYSSQLEAPGITISIPTGPHPSQFVLRGETFTVNPSQLILPDRTIPLPRNMITPAPSSITAEGVLVSVGSSAVVIGSRTYPLQSPTSIIYNGHSISIGPNGVGMASTTIALPSIPTFSTVTEGALTLLVNPSEAVIQGHSYLLTQGAAPITTVIEGQSISIGPDGVAFAGTTAVIPRPTEAYHLTIIDGLTFSVGPTDVVVAGKTYAIGGGAKPQTATIGSEIISFGPGGIGLPGTTVAPTASIFTADGLIFSLEPTDAVIGGTTYRVGAGASPTTITVGGEIISIGPEGIGLPGTTVAPAASIVTADGLTFSIEPTDVVIKGTTYQVGAGASPTTITVEGETISIGPGGIGLPETTIAPASVVTADGLTFSLEPSDVVISGTTYPIGAGARQTTITVEGATVSIGPGGIGLPDTTILPPSTITPGPSSSIVLSPATSSSPEGSGLAFDDFAGACTTLRIPIDSISLPLFLGLWTLILLLV
ncbi:MAG: hypothetical protein HETSPECPRED_003077 [Heterodermia speciosa]|uniref:Uncharacterized protein n=1 Tax=Heterodermia speciosa TaxID=116794 RepID=A0A8H3F3P5_9LECA|nr:MAG: hypothetical protein HETSPECPRED_003077 [Heterodermia speciosa]